MIYFDLARRAPNPGVQSGDVIFWLAKLGSHHLQAQSSVATVPAAAAQQGLATRCSVPERARAPGYIRERTQARRKDDHASRRPGPINVTGPGQSGAQSVTQRLTAVSG